MWHSMTSEVILHFMKNLCIHTVSIHRNVYQNWFINECARKNLAKIPKLQIIHIVMWFFLWDVEELTFLKVAWKYDEEIMINLTLIDMIL